MPFLQHTQPSPHALGVMFDIAPCRGKLRVVENACYGVDVLPGAPEAGPYGVPEVMETEAGNARQLDSPVPCPYQVPSDDRSILRRKT